MDYSNVFVCLMGMGTVFFGLICLIVLISLMSVVCRSRKTVEAAAPAPVSVPAKVNANRQEMVAAMSAAIAEELGTDVTGIRIHSITKI